MAKHTPGPWLEDHTAEPEVMAQALLENPSWVAVEDASENGGHVAYCAPENAPLIAAGPVMLAALEAAYTSLIARLGPAHPITCQVGAAIAKAT
jgi:hypothetical protein